VLLRLQTHLGTRLLFFVLVVIPGVELGARASVSRADVRPSFCAQG